MTSYYDLYEDLSSKTIEEFNPKFVIFILASTIVYSIIKYSYL